MRYSSILLTALATSSVTLAAPSQLVLSDLVSAPDAAAVDATSGHHRDPDFVDRLEAESQRLKSVAASASSAAASPAFWPGQPNDPPGGGGWVWSSCGSPDDLVTVEAIAVSPDPPVPGKNLTVTAKGIVKGAIEDGSFADVTVKIGLIKLLSRQFDICEEAQKNNVTVQCPVQPGEYEITQVVALPREIPPAKFNVHVDAFGANDENLTCLDIAIDFRKH